MKSFKLITASLLAIAAASVAPAQTLIKITGSTAFRKGTVNSIVNLINTPTAFYVGTTANNLGGAGQAVIRGTLKNALTSGGTTLIAGTDVAFQLAWTGSAGGVQTLTTNSNVTLTGSGQSTSTAWLSVSNITSPASGSGGTSGAITVTGNSTSAVVFNGGYYTNGVTPAYDAASAANIAMSDTFQATSGFIGGSYNSLSGVPVGVVPFVWVKSTNANSLTTFSNMSGNLAINILTNGQVPLSFFTGSASDTANVTILGRDEDSGTRLVTFAESAFGTTSTPAQYEAFFDGSTTATTGTTITSLQPYHTQAVNGVTNPNAGFSGYASGGTLAGILKKAVSGSLGYLVGYVSVGDSSGLTQLTYNGVAYSATAVANGTYTFWAYENLFYRSDASATVKAIGTGLTNQLTSTDAAVSGILLSALNVGRSAEGAVVTAGAAF